MVTLHHSTTKRVVVKVGEGKGGGEIFNL
uniref:Uncharacterized protein n=1 Tax=Anguilla anguilla TaxID=7936 RepID=A0A0E9PM04_ANGAN